MATVSDDFNIARESTQKNLLAVNQAINTTLQSIKGALDIHNTNFAGWAGNLSSLTTGDKTNLVAAINWVLNKEAAHEQTAAMHDVYAYLDSISTAENGAFIHNSLYRGKNLGSSLTSDMSANIQNGTFKNLWMGDYLNKSVTYSYPDYSKEDNALTTTTKTLTSRFLHHNYYKNCGDTSTSENHSVMAMDQSLFSAPMNKGVNTTEGGYVNSDMYETYLAGAINAFVAFFGVNHMLKHRNMLVNAVSNGRPSAGAWISRKLDLMNEPMVYGSYIFTTGNDGINVPYRYTIEKSQLAAFALNPTLISTRYWWWLRDVVSAASFAHVGHLGPCDSHDASSVGGVRPAALIY